VVRAAGTDSALTGTSPVESRSSRAENRLSEGEAQREPIPERRVDFELRSRGGATGLAHRDLHQISTEAGSGAVAESTGESSGRVSNQTVQRGQRFPRSQWPTDSARHRSGETDPARLRGLGDRRSQATDEELRDALNGQPLPLHRKRLTLYRGVDLAHRSYLQFTGIFLSGHQHCSPPFNVAGPLS
jgi:hypothetical protein